MSKYALAKTAVQDLDQVAAQNNIDAQEAHEALLVTLVQVLKEDAGAAHVRGFLQYELDTLGSGGLHDITRGGGHS